MAIELKELLIRGILGRGKTENEEEENEKIIKGCGNKKNNNLKSQMDALTKMMEDKNER